MADPRNSKKQGGSRYYEVEGLSVPSVTTILDCLPKPALPRWAAKVAAEYAYDAYLSPGVTDLDPEAIIKDIKNAPFRQRDQKANLGTVVHEALESYLGGKSDEQILNELPADHAGYFYGVLHFLDAVEPQIEAAEATVFSKGWGYAGTADIIGLVHGVRTVIDLKTSKDIYTSHGAQIAAYAKAELIVRDDKLEQWEGAERGIVVCVNADGEFKAVPFNDLKPWFELFQAAYSVWEQQNLRVPKPLWSN